MIVSEAKKYMNANPKEHDLFDKNDKSSRLKLSNICFSQILPYVNNMKEFYTDDRFIVKITNNINLNNYINNTNNNNYISNNIKKIIIV